MGRTVHPSFIAGEKPVGSSGTVAPGHAHTYDGRLPYSRARALDVHEIPGLLEDFRQATANALDAGFDGVQIHAANGYLIDEFLRDGANHRSDHYGGSIKNRLRLLLEVTAAVASVAGAERTGVRLSPNGETQGVRDSDPVPLFQAAATELSAIGIAHLELREPPLDGTFGKGDIPPIASVIRGSFPGVLILNSDFDGTRAQADLDAGIGDAVAFGRPFIANPDLPRRLRQGLPLSKDDPDAWFTQGEAGYLGYA